MLPPRVGNYSFTEVELVGLYVNNSQLRHLLAILDFDSTMHHLALAYIMKSKIEPSSARIKRLLGVLSIYAFKPYL